VRTKNLPAKIISAFGRGEGRGARSDSGPESKNADPSDYRPERLQQQHGPGGRSETFKRIRIVSVPTLILCASV